MRRLFFDRYGLRAWALVVGMAIALALIFAGMVLTLQPTEPTTTTITCVWKGDNQRGQYVCTATD